MVENITQYLLYLLFDIIVLIFMIDYETNIVSLCYLLYILIII